MNYRLETHGKLAAGAPQIDRGKIVRAMVLASEALLSEVAIRTPAGGTGNLRASLGAATETVGNQIISTVSANARYALAVETGARPHFPWDAETQSIPDSLRQWVAAKLSVRRAEPSLKREIKAGRVPGRPPKQDESEAELDRMTRAVAFAIKARGTSHPPGGGVREGPTGGQGYFMFEDAQIQSMGKIQDAFFTPLGLELKADLES